MINSNNNNNNTQKKKKKKKENRVVRFVWESLHVTTRPEWPYTF